MKKDLRQQHDEFLKKHKTFYNDLIKLLADCIEKDDVAELSLHISYISKCIEKALQLRLAMQQSSRAGNA
ncbi:MAG: hypothetical protein IBX72_14725 [Nitrospirae bacterium]|nr:hypothetical protein [Nitrospirota bacterium]